MIGDQRHTTVLILQDEDFPYLRVTVEIDTLSGDDPAWPLVRALRSAALAEPGPALPLMRIGIGDIAHEMTIVSCATKTRLEGDLLWRE